MSAHGINIAEECHVVPEVTPRNIKAAKSGDVIFFKNYAHASVIIMLGATMGGASIVTLEECDDATPTTSPAINFDYYKWDGLATYTDKLGNKSTTTATTGVSLAASAGAFCVVELDADTLDAGYTGFRVNFGAAGAAAYGAMVCVLSGNRYASKPSNHLTAVVA